MDTLALNSYNEMIQQRFNPPYSCLKVRFLKDSELRLKYIGNQQEGCRLPKQLQLTDRILVLYGWRCNKLKASDILSILWISGVGKSLQFVYGYTHNQPELRRKGLNRLLRIIAIDLASRLGLKEILSQPLPEAYSSGLLDSLGFSNCSSISNDNHYTLKRLDICAWEKSKLYSYIDLHFSRYLK